MDRKWLSCATCLLGVLLLVSGCEDQMARQESAKATNALESLTKEVTALRAEVKENKDKLELVQAGLTNKINADAGKLKKSMDGIHASLDKKINEQRNDLAKNMANQFESTRSDFDSRLRQSLKGVVARQFTEIREKIETNRKELLGFMDKQLRELYPYAYQPKRMDAAAPPKKPQE